jgi:hypothetical protein
MADPDADRDDARHAVRSEADLRALEKELGAR